DTPGATIRANGDDGGHEAPVAGSGWPGRGLSAERARRSGCLPLYGTAVPRSKTIHAPSFTVRLVVSGCCLVAQVSRPVQPSQVGRPVPQDTFNRIVYQTGTPAG